MLKIRPQSTQRKKIQVPMKLAEKMFSKIKSGSNFDLKMRGEMIF
jgi:hypothetical protein